MTSCWIRPIFIDIHCTYLHAIHIFQVKKEQQNTEFHPELSSDVYNRYTTLIDESIWGNKPQLALWFPEADVSARLKHLSCDHDALVPVFSLKFYDGKEQQSKFCEESFFKSFSADEEVRLIKFKLSLKFGTCKLIMLTHYIMIHMKVPNNCSLTLFVKIVTIHE